MKVIISKDDQLLWFDYNLVDVLGKLITENLRARRRWSVDNNHGDVYEAMPECHLCVLEGSVGVCRLNLDAVGRPLKDCNTSTGLGWAWHMMQAIPRLLQCCHRGLVTVTGAEPGVHDGTNVSFGVRQKLQQGSSFVSYRTSVDEADTSFVNIVSFTCSSSFTSTHFNETCESLLRLWSAHLAGSDGHNGPDGALLANTSPTATGCLWCRFEVKWMLPGSSEPFKLASDRYGKVDMSINCTDWPVFFLHGYSPLGTTFPYIPMKSA